MTNRDNANQTDLRPQGQYVIGSSVAESLIQIQGVNGPLYINSKAPRYQVRRLPETPAPISADAARARPLELLLAKNEVVQFTGRESELAALSKWRDSADEASVVLIHGAGGEGKTRLALRHLQRSQSSRWDSWTAEIGPDRAQRDVPAINTEDANSPGPGTTILVDYADRWQVRDLLTLATDEKWTRYSRLRLIFVARHAGTWWQDLSYKLSNFGFSHQRLPVNALGETTGSSQLFASACRGFAAAQGLLDEELDRCLSNPPRRHLPSIRDVQMAALAAVDSVSQHKNEPNESAGQISRYLLNRERDYWAHLFENHRTRLDADSMAQVVWVSALVGPLDYHDGTGAITCSAAGAPLPADSVLKDHAVAFPAANNSTVLERIQPSALAEDFLALSIPGHDIDSWFPDLWTLEALRRMVVAGNESPINSWRGAAIGSLLSAGSRWEHVMMNHLKPLLEQDPKLALQATGEALGRIAHMDTLSISLLRRILSEAPGDRDINLDSGLAVLASKVIEYDLRTTSDPADQAEMLAYLARRQYLAGAVNTAIETMASALISFEDAVSKDGRVRPEYAECLLEMAVYNEETGKSMQALQKSKSAEAAIRMMTAEKSLPLVNLAFALARLAICQVGGRRPEWCL